MNARIIALFGLSLAFAGAFTGSSFAETPKPASVAEPSVSTSNSTGYVPYARRLARNC